MSLSSSNSRLWQATATFALVLPALSIVGVRFLSPRTAPAAARAQATDTKYVLQSIINRPYTAEHRQIAGVMKAADKVKFGESPLRAPALVIDPGSGPPIIPTDPAEGPQAASLFALTSILGTPDHPLAVINGKVRNPDDQLDKGWKLLTIDIPAGTVELVNESGQHATLFLPRPEIERTPDNGAKPR